VLQQETVANGEIGIFSLNGDAYIKKLQDDKNGISLISLNEKYAPIEIGENDRFDIFGKVVGKSNVSDIPRYKG
jgi:SOS-response transcriptional repressor LexA